MLYKVQCILMIELVCKIKRSNLSDSEIHFIGFLELQSQKYWSTYEAAIFNIIGLWDSHILGTAAFLYAFLHAFLHAPPTVCMHAQHGKAIQHTTNTMKTTR